MSTHDHVDAGTLFRTHASFVAGFALRLGATRADLDDLVQEVFMIAHRRGGYRPGPAQPRTWLADIAIRVLANRRRSQRRARVHVDDAAVTEARDETASPDSRVEDRQALRRVQASLDRLDEDKRAVFVLFELVGESCESIAAGLGLAIGTVWSRLHAARAQFTKAHAKLSRVGRADARAQPARSER